MNETEAIAVISIDNLVVFPETEVLIYIADKKTTNLIKESVDNDSPLAVCAAHELRKDVSHMNSEIIGCLATVHIETIQPDGSIYALLKVRRRIILTKVIQNIPYVIYNYKNLPDYHDHKSQTFEGHVIRELKNKLLNWSNENIIDSMERDYFDSQLTGLRVITNYACMYLISSGQLRQSLLENKSLFDRVHILNLLLQADFSHNGSLLEQAFIDYKDIEHTASFAH
jgi:ATP-dependent Lon protease